MPNAPLYLFTTGGTIDKTYGSGVGVRDLHIGPPVAPGFLRGQRQTFRGELMRINHHEICRKDSLDMTEQDRLIIARKCGRSSRFARILITHGTDTMVETAEAIRGYLRNLFHRRIVLTGALLPACVVGTDAYFNLGLALASCYSLPPGIYIAMNGIHEWDKCFKNPKTGAFAHL